MKAMEAKGKSKEEIDEFKKAAPGALKTITANLENYDTYVGESMTDGSMFVLVDFREDGVTPYATIWKHGLEEMKV